MMWHVLLLGVSLAQQPAPAQAPAAAAEPAKNLSFEVYRTQIEPILLKKRPGNVACVTCHGGGASSQLRLQPLLPGAMEWNEEQSRKNFDAIARFVVTNNPLRSRFLRHPLDMAAGGDPFHGGGKHWHSQSDPEWQLLSNWVMNKTAPTPKKVTRIIQSNAAGDNLHIIDPATNKVVGIVNDVEVVHGVVSSPDGSRIYVTIEPEEVMAVIDPKTLTVTKKVKLTGRPNNLTVSNDGKRVYVGIAQAPGAVDIIDAVALTRVKSIPVDGPIHNVYTTPDGKYIVSGSVASSVITVIDQAKEEVAWSVKLSSGIRPMTFQKNPDGSTKNIIVQLSNFHGMAVVDFATHKEIARMEHPAIPGHEAHYDGLQGAPAHGLAIPDGKTVWSTSKVYGYAYIYSLDDWKLLGSVAVGQHPEWVTLTPDGKTAYIAACGDNAVTVIDVATRKEIAKIPVGQAPKRNTTAILESN